jgi:hypothetical protein
MLCAAVEFKTMAEPAPALPLSPKGGSGVARQSWSTVTSTPSRLSHPITPDAELPAPCTKVHGFLPAHALSFAVQSTERVRPSRSNTVPPQLFAATARWHEHAMLGIDVDGKLTAVALMARGIRASRC